jgi:hypothetical protein
MVVSAGTGIDTVTVAVAVAEPDVAVIVAVPLATAVMSPADDTVATDEFDVFHVTDAPDIVAPFWSLTVAESWDVAPADERVTLVEDNVIDVAVWVTATVTVAVAVAEPDVAVIVAVPSATEVTRPDDETVATDAADEVHVTLAPLIVAPFWSLTVAVS